MKRRAFISLAGLAAVLGLPSLGRAAQDCIFTKSAGIISCAPPLPKCTFEIMEVPYREAVVKVMGIGGCGGNAVDHMITHGIRGVEFICADTNGQALKRSRAPTQLHLASEIAGARAHPHVERQAALECRARIIDLIGGADMLFLIAGMGGRTGTRTAPAVAEIARELGIVTIAVVTMPFVFEGGRKRIAQAGIGALSKITSSPLVIPNDKMIKIVGNGVTLDSAFRAANDAMHRTVAGIAEIVTGMDTSLCGVDFSDVRTVMAETGLAMMGSAKAAGVDRARKAVANALESPLLEHINIADARCMMVNISSSMSLLQLQELFDVMDVIKAIASESAIVMAGTVYDDALGDELRVTIIATGLRGSHAYS